ncbi:MAG TPA: hypothetical protein VGC10_09315 [Sphingomonas sp.]
MRRRTLAALGLALLLAGSAAVAARPATPPKTYPTGVFTIAGKPVAARDILDARALPDMAGRPSLMITLTPTAADAIATAAGPEHLPCTLDGKPIGASARDTLASDHILQISGDFGDYDATAALARRISGRDPLPDSEGDQ